MRNTTNAGPIEWPFKNMKMFAWSDKLPDYKKRMRAMAENAQHWTRVLEAIDN